MTRTALARRYRPRRFGEIALQDHVSGTLSTAVARGRVAHAYLFCGPRGVGKTTAARVLAMALNCPDRTAEGEPCGQCESCDRIWAGRTSLDVVEIDAASNRGVDDARDLRERAMYAPSDHEHHKVYIIDEAHMLTREAWNTLLKILEEPPPRVIFVFATTEPQKIQQAAPPILSRCQRFDFRRIRVSGIVEQLRQVLAAEGVEADDDALVPLARRAEGGMRDALSLLDQVLSFAADRRITAADVRQVLGLVGDELYLDLFDILAERRHADVFHFVERLLDEGYDFAEFYRGLADALRRLMVVKFEGAEAADVPEELRDASAAAAARFATGDLVRMLAAVAELDTDGRFRKSANPRILLEALLLRFAHLDRTIAIEDLLNAAAGDVDVAPATTPPAPASAARAAAPRPKTAAGPVPGTGAPATAGAPTSAAPPSARPDASAPAAPHASREESARTNDADPDPEGGGLDARSATVDPAAAFQAVLRDGDGVPPGLGFFLRAARVVPGAGDDLVLELPPGPGLERLAGGAADRRSLQTALARRLGRDVQLQVRAQDGTGERAAPPPRLTPEQVKQDRIERLVREEPLLGRAVQEWDLESID